MSLRRFLTVLLIAMIFFLAGVAVGRFVMPRKVHITVVNIKDLVEIIERYNEAKWELERIREWNEEVFVEPVPEEEESEKNN
ncbi:hypothetical protein ES703_98088 [subsurface metagenome]|nr:hypothetical protein [bacterium]